MWSPTGVFFMSGRMSISLLTVKVKQDLKKWQVRQVWAWELAASGSCVSFSHKVLRKGK